MTTNITNGSTNSRTESMECDSECIHLNTLVSRSCPYVIPPSISGYVNLSVIQSFTKHPDMDMLPVDIRVYPSLERHVELKHMLHDHLFGFYNDSVSIALTAGSGAALVLILRTFCDSDSRIVIAHPNYPGFIHDAELTSSDVQFVNVKTEADLLTHEFMTLAKSARVVYLSSPSIPYGYLVTPDIVDTIKSTPQTLWVIDEAYIEWLPTRFQRMMSSQLSSLPNLMIVRTFSKAFAAAGIRLGYIVGNAGLMAPLSTHLCTKAIPQYSIDIAISILRNRNYYLESARDDILRWRKWITKVNNTTGYYVRWSGLTPFCIIECPNADKMCEFMKTHGILVRDKTADIGVECVRICLASDEVLSRVYSVLRLCEATDLNLISDIFLDLDRTLRDNYVSAIDKRIVSIVNKLSKRVRVHVVSDNRCNYKVLEEYLMINGLDNVDLISPLKTHRLELSLLDGERGYLVANDCVYVFKFPHMSMELLQAVNKTKHVRVIETDDWEDSFESTGVEPSFRVPFVGKFISLLSSDVCIECIGKQAVSVDTCIDMSDARVGVMIGDSDTDQAFAHNNGLVFKRVNCPADTLEYLSSLV